MLVSIVIVTFNALEHTKRCVQSISAYTSAPPYHLIFVDNASTDGTVEYLRALPGSTVIANADNRGFPAAANQGIAASRGEYVLLLNNDVKVTPGWLERLVDVAECHDRVGAVGPVSDGVGEIQRDDVFSGRMGDDAALLRHAAEVAAFNRSQSFEFHRVAGFCMLLSREAIERVGGLDEAFGVGFYDDDDLCLRLRRAGYRIMVAPDVFVHHVGGASFATSGGTFGRPGDIQGRLNRDRFLDKWFRRPRLLTSLDRVAAGPSVSVLMPTFNRRRWLPRAIESVVAQSYPQFEAIVVNDGGECVEDVVQQFADERLVYVELPRGGKSKALNVAAGMATGDLICYLDDDDIYYPCHLETLVAAHLENPSRQALYSDAVVAYYSSGSSGQPTLVARQCFPSREVTRAMLLEHNHIPSLSLMHQRSLFRRAGLFDETLEALEDWDFLRRLSMVTDLFHVPVLTAEFSVDVEGKTRNWSLFASTLTQLADSIRRKPTIPVQTFEYGVTQAMEVATTGSLMNAAAICASILQQEPAHLAAFQLLVTCLDQLGQYALSEPYQRAVMERRPDYFHGVMSYAKLCLGLGRIEKSKEMLQLALVVNPSEAEFSQEIYTLLGECYDALGNPGSAVACRGKARRLSGDYRIADLGEALRRFRFYVRSEGLRRSLWRGRAALAQHLRVLHRRLVRIN